MYSQAVMNENYLRGVQEADATGKVTFTTNLPGSPPGRWPHIHSRSTRPWPWPRSSRNKRATSQLALTDDVTRRVRDRGRRAERAEPQPGSTVLPILCSATVTDWSTPNHHW